MLSSGPRRVESVEGVERVLGNGNRVFAETYKQSLVERCLQPGTSVSRVALEHGINANLLRKWIDKRTPRSSGVATLVPVMIAPAINEVQPAAAATQSARPPGIIEIEIGRARVRLCGEVDAQLRCPRRFVEPESRVRSTRDGDRTDEEAIHRGTDHWLPA